ncbi:UDP-N-acetylglucosamine 2-epimerase [Magnetospirillum sp. UT-4]|uniref:UDP-N-acetylglucosamine 2-epimerase n=1 Tax=Magnetospirillum sp. UT-4 TaxID=2681467 RepID=UPI001383BF50|nr:UDP-N-acetylglucosamine 2-epimerase [Magnetospirillum sp. UT-4]CAA7621680.1 UDP-N-acetylglucosamine 2-epimerase [Magnetospirillum sp. UT-4]
MSRTIGIVTSARADFGLLRGLMAAVRGAAGLDLLVYATGMHQSPAHGHTIDEVLAAGFGPVLVEVAALPADDGAAAVGDAIGRAVCGFSAAFAARRPDLLVVLGDRFDALPAALAALPFTLPVAHLCGGDVTEGAMDDSIRHALSKLSHLHFPQLESHAERLRRMGEEAWRITVVGQPGLDEVVAFRPRPRPEVLGGLGLDPARPVTVLTYHPETLAPGDGADAVAALLRAAAGMDSQMVFTAPNADPGNAPIRAAIEAFAAGRPGCVYRQSLGRTLYLEMLNHADAMVGNSSSGLIEAASFRLPVVNIGERQRGRLAPANVITCADDADAIAAAWRRALDPGFRAGLAGLVNPYGDGRSVEKVLAVLATVPLDRRLIVKRFAGADP